MQATIFAIIIFIVVFAIVVVAAVMIRRYLSNRSPLKVDRPFTRADVGKHSKASKIQPVSEKPHKSADDTQRSVSTSRTRIFGIITAVVMGVLAIKDWSLQILGNEEYTSQAENNMTATSSIAAKRGRILDRNGKEMIVNRASRTVVGDSTVVDNDKVVHRLSLVLGIPKQAIRARLNDESTGAQGDRAIASDVSMRAISFIAENPTVFPGVSIETRTTRYYPYGTVGAHLLGYTGTISEDELNNQPEGMDYESGDVVGKAGAEAAFETLLQGTKGTRTYKVNSNGDNLGVVSEVDPDDGNDVKLTVDLEVQQVAEEALQSALTNAQSAGHSNATRGAIVAVDVNNGEILAMASAPTYNPNDFTGGISSELWDSLNSEDSGYPMTNRAIAGQYPAASTYKAFTGLAGLQYGLITATTEYACGGTWTGFGTDYPKKCWQTAGHGYLNIYYAIAYSCDIYFYEVAKDFYNYEGNSEALQDYLKSWGFGSDTGVDIAGEQPGRVPTPEWKAEYYWETPEDAQWVPGDLANMVIGQGDVLVTPIQMAVNYAGIATGTIYKPHLFYEALNGDGQVVISAKTEKSDFTPEASEENLQIIRDALRLAVTQGGVSSVWVGFDYDMAAKSGTGEAGGNRDDYAWFCAYGPFDSPKYACACVIEEGGGGTAIAGPPVRTVMAKLLGVSDDTEVSVTETGER